jgi:hypothetical protein
MAVDYVTEKVYAPLRAGSIPLYLGAPNVDTFVPEGSLINLVDFVNVSPYKDGSLRIADLARYLVYLSSNETAYQEYHQWRHALVPRHMQQLTNALDIESSLCRLCHCINGRGHGCGHMSRAKGSTGVNTTKRR